MGGAFKTRLHFSDISGTFWWLRGFLWLRSNFLRSRPLFYLIGDFLKFGGYFSRFNIRDSFSISANFLKISLTLFDIMWFSFDFGVVFKIFNLYDPFFTFYTLFHFPCTGSPFKINPFQKTQAPLLKTL